MELTITKITRTQRTSPKTNKPFTSVGIQTIEHGSRWLSGFGSAVNASWKEGDKIDVIVEESSKMDKEGKPYLNFTMPKVVSGGMSEQDRELLNEIKIGINMLTREVASVKALLSRPENTPMEEELPPMPFPTDF